ncbi:DNA-binding response regulator [Treponema phagedenis]|uniref:Response regulator receiver domain protein n=1 Tax=Treponema phagedenis TaxID=162 RepID=A0A0B7GZ95_TREPH|nr:response regulator transcription factor [Treponema phagedenis]EFW38489.1 response regulator receiver domain protein [Treponema phagedenis F0421]NVP24226.1 response regulator transcription factor [Treponema phagedenis]QEJ94200.1 response regulator transcription factor [Treponema phagedenis]QEJ99215.1 response regulator transcription factor [Treponema phagedenis]QEK00158.1 response regulator transcription factor [Treponema phagedenis]
MNIIIIDDDPLVISSLTTILTANKFTISACGSDGEEAIQLFKKFKPDILLMDIRMEGVNGITASEKILKEYKDAKILLLTTFQDEEYITKALNFGCRGYILKQNIESLVPALNAIAAGSIVFDSQIMNKIPTKKPQKEKFFEDLNEREADILELIADGLNNKEIAQRLYLSEGTIRNYVSSILEKLALRDRTQLVVYYYTK